MQNDQTETCEASLDRIDYYTLIFLIFIAVCSYSALFFARLGLFSAVVVLLCGALAAVLSVWRLPPTRQSASSGRFSLPLLALLGVTVLGALSAGLFNINEMYAGRDPGIYMLISEWTADTGAADLTLPVLEDAYDRHRSFVTRYPGVYFTPEHDPTANWGSHPGNWNMVGQFNDLTPTIRAVFVQLFGWSGHGLSTAFFAGAALFMLGVVARRFGFAWAGVVASTLLLLNMSFVYASRTYLTEVPVVFFLFSAVFALSLLERRDVPPMLSVGLTAAFIGLTFFARPDGYLVIVLLTAFAGLNLAQRPDFDPKPVVLFVFVGALGLLSFVDLYEHTRKYLHDLYTTRSLNLVVFVSLGIGLTGLLISALGPAVLKRKALLQGFYEMTVRWVPSTIAILAIFWFAYVFWIGAQVDLEAAALATGAQRVEVFQDRRMWELAWYLTVPIILLFLFGAAHLMKQKDRSIAMDALIMFALAGFLIFTFRTQIYPDHPWVSRRWLPFLTAPALFVAAIVMSQIVSRYRTLGLAVSAVIVGYYAVSNARLIGDWAFVQPQREWKQNYDDVVAELEDHPAAYYFARPIAAASVLTFQYGVPTLALEPGAGPQNQLRQVVQARPFCGTAITNWNGYAHYFTGGMRGAVRERCFNLNVFVFDPDLVLGANHTIHFAARGDGISFLESGWHVPEGWGVWSAESVAEMELPVTRELIEKAEELGTDIRLVFKMRSFIGPGQQPQRVGLQINEAAPMDLSIGERFDEYEFDVSVADLAEDKTISLRFTLPDTRSPKDVGISEDRRMLGVGLKSVSFDLVPTAN